MAMTGMAAVHMIIPVASSVSHLQCDMKDTKVTVMQTGESYTQIILPMTRRTVMSLKS